MLRGKEIQNGALMQTKKFARVHGFALKTQQVDVPPPAPPASGFRARYHDKGRSCPLTLTTPMRVGYANRGLHAPVTPAQSYALCTATGRPS